MSRKNIKVRSKKKIRTDLMKEIERDGKNREEIVKLLRKVLSFCQKNNVQPETLLIELNTVNSLAIQVYMKKHESQIVGDLDRELSDSEACTLHKDFDRALTQIVKLSRHKRRSKVGTNGEKPAPAIKETAPMNNEEMPYQSSNERPYYIN